MKLKTQMQKTGILTVENGIFQAQNNGVLYQEFNPRFEKYSFAGDAKAIFEAMSLMDMNFIVRKEVGQILFVDGQQEIRIPEMIPDELIDIPLSYDKEIAQDLVHKLKALRPFTTPDFPGWFFKEGTIEALHPSMIVRALNPTTIRGAFSVDALPAGCGGGVETDKGLWLKYDTGVICLGRLDINAPDTSAFFNQSPAMNPIPPIILERWIACETVRWDKTDLCLLPHSRIENIWGRGAYDGKLFYKIIKNAKYWAVTADLLHFAGDCYVGVLENVDSRTI